MTPSLMKTYLGGMSGRSVNSYATLAVRSFRASCTPGLSLYSLTYSSSHSIEPKATSW